MSEFHALRLNKWRAKCWFAGWRAKFMCRSVIARQGGPVQFGDVIRGTLPVSSILLGFLFAGFWWTLNRELTFKPEERHFKLGIGLQLVGMVMLAVFGVVLPMRAIAYSNPGLLLEYRGVVLALIVIFGYMLTDLGHYGVFRRSKYTTRSEKLVFAGTLLAVFALIVKWRFF
jgi:hypothetical protein